MTIATITAQTEPAAAVILAGGKSSRMGQNKALLPWMGERLVDYVAQTAREAECEVYVSGLVEGYPCINDSVAGCGPVAGICSSILALPHPLLLFIPVDMPRISPDCLRRLISEIGEQDACHFTGHPLPCALRVTPRLRAYAREALARIEAGDSCSVRDFLSELTCISLEPEDSPALTNTNTPQEWQEATHEPAHQ